MKLVQRLWKYSDGYRYIWILLPLTVLVQVILEVWIPYIMGEMLDIGIYAGSMQVIIGQGVRMILASVGMMAAGLAISRMIAAWSAGITKNMRNVLFDQVQQLSFSDTDAYGTAAILTRMSTDISYVKKGLGMFHSLIRSPMMVIVTVVVTIKAYPSVAGIFLASAGGFILVNVFIVRIALRHYRRMFECYDETNEILSENVTAQKTVKAFARESYEQERYTNKADRLRRENRIAETITAIGDPLMNLVIDICILVIVVFCAGGIIGGSMQTGDYFCLITYANQFLYQISMVALIMVPILNAMVSMGRIFELTEKESEDSGEEAGKK